MAAVHYSTDLQRLPPGAVSGTVVENEDVRHREFSAKIPNNTVHRQFFVEAGNQYGDSGNTVNVHSPRLQKNFPQPTLSRIEKLQKHETQIGKALVRLVVCQGNAHRLAAADYYRQFARPSEGSVQQIPL